VHRVLDITLADSSFGGSDRGRVFPYPEKAGVYYLIYRKLLLFQTQGLQLSDIFLD